MRLPTGSFVLTALSLLSIPPEIKAQTDRPIEARWSCFTEYGQSTIYTTQVWDATAFLIEVTNDFGRFLLAEYGYKGRVSCGGALLPTSTTAQLTDDNARTRALWRGEGKTVIELDVGCGTGIVARLAAQAVGSEGSVAGLDVEPGMLAVARSAAAGAGIEWIEASAESIPLPDESFYHPAIRICGTEYF